MPGSKWQAAGERREREDSNQTGFQGTKLSRAPHTEQDYPGGDISSARTMLLVFGREGGDSVRNLNRRERWLLQKATFTRIPPNTTKVL